jgi:hypothetical protein
VVSFALLPLYPRYRLARRLGGPQSRMLLHYSVSPLVSTSNLVDGFIYKLKVSVRTILVSSDQLNVKSINFIGISSVVVRPG